MQTAKKAQIIDIDGKLLHQWDLPAFPGRHAIILNNGNLGFNGKHPDAPPCYPAWEIWHGGLFVEMTPDGKEVWRHEDLAHHHDCQWLPNGNLLYTTVEPIPYAVASRVRGGKPIETGTVYGDVVKEVDRNHNTVWLWRSWEHLNPEEFPIHPIFDQSHWPLINGVNVTREGLVLMSLRTTSGIIAVEKPTGKVKWKIGHNILAQQHAPSELENGNILAFDNGNFRFGATVPYSRIVEVCPRNAEVVWEYHDDMKPSFFSPYMGSAQKLENENVHITESAMGRLFEVTKKGEVVWEYIVPNFNSYPDGSARMYATGHHNSVFKSMRYKRSQLVWL
jgi:hypothetical protein